MEKIYNFVANTILFLFLFATAISLFIVFCVGVFHFIVGIFSTNLWWYVLYSLGGLLFGLLLIIFNPAHPDSSIVPPKKKKSFFIFNKRDN